jgi:hypothetical protein
MTVAEASPAISRPLEIVSGDTPGGPSTSQTILVASLQRLLGQVPAEAAPEAYRSAVMDDNVLAKQTFGGREWAFRQLRRFYGLDPRLLLFRALRDLWSDDTDGQPVLAVLCALARDPVLRASSAVIFATESGAGVGAADFDAAITDAFPGAYANSTRRTTAGNVASSWRQSGHLCVEKTRKTRCRAVCTPADVAYGLLLGHVQGVRGHALFETVWAQALDQPISHLFDLAATASQYGMLEFRHAGGVVEVTFRELLRPFDNEPPIRLL